MLGFKCVTNPPINPKLLPIIQQNNIFPDHFLTKSKPHYKIPKNPSRFILFAQNSDNNNNDNITKESNGDGKQQQQQKQQQKGSTNGDDMEKDRLRESNIKWGEIFNPDPDNFFAVGLTGLLTWASVQVLWQLFIISLAIVVAALKYSFIAALLIFILITLL